MGRKRSPEKKPLSITWPSSSKRPPPPTKEEEDEGLKSVMGGEGEGEREGEAALDTNALLRGKERTPGKPTISLERPTFVRRPWLRKSRRPMIRERHEGGPLVAAPWGTRA